MPSKLIRRIKMKTNDTLSDRISKVVYKDELGNYEVYDSIRAKYVKEKLQEVVDEIERLFKPITDFEFDSFMELRDDMKYEIVKILKQKMGGKLI